MNNEDDHCCTPAFPEDARSGRHGRNLMEFGRTVSNSRIDQIRIPSGQFVMGESSPAGRSADGETLLHRVSLSSFSVDATTVTNREFARFVDDTSYQTEAEAFGFSAVFHLAVRADRADLVGIPDETPWWIGIRGADWRHPGGRHSDLAGLEDHPVVHVSWNDAQQYCAWAVRRLPTEAEWEYASRGGLEGAMYPWGDDPPDGGGAWRCNIWQGHFPYVNDQDDGWLATAPARSFEPNGYGLWQTVGNVWEWCEDWFGAGYYGSSPQVDPRGPAEGSARVLRGGSYLCHDSYCDRYRNAARSSNTPDSSSGNVGFRTVSL